MSRLVAIVLSLFLFNPVWGQSKKTIIKNLQANKDSLILSAIAKDNKIDSLKNIILMSNFKNYLIDNSTYHWWGSWLSENSRKIIFIPNDFNSKIIYRNCKFSLE